MSNKIYPCLWMDGQGHDAADFYCRVLKNTVKVSDTGLVQVITISGKKLMFLNGGPMFRINPSMSFFLMNESEEATREQWAALAENGKVMMPLDKYPWNSCYGWCQDQFGVNWQLLTGDVMGQDQLVPSLMFTGDNSGHAEEAMHFYTSVFPGSAIGEINRYADNEGDVPGYVKHGRFHLFDCPFTIMDSSAPHGFQLTEANSLVIDCENQEEVDDYWTKLLAEGGEESQCGWLKDPFGLSWQVVPRQLPELLMHPDKEKANRVMQAMMKMKRIIVADLEKAAAGTN